MALFCYLSIAIRLRLSCGLLGLFCFVYFVIFLAGFGTDGPYRTSTRGWMGFFLLLGWGRGWDLYCTIACGLLENVASEFACVGCEKGEASGARMGVDAS